MTDPTPGDGPTFDLHQVDADVAWAAALSAELGYRVCGVIHVLEGDALSVALGVIGRRNPCVFREAHSGPHSWWAST